MPTCGALIFAPVVPLWLLALGAAFTAHPQPKLPNQAVSPPSRCTAVPVQRSSPASWVHRARGPADKSSPNALSATRRPPSAGSIPGCQATRARGMPEDRWQMAKRLQQQTPLCQKRVGEKRLPRPQHRTIVKSKSKGYCDEHTLPAQLLIVKKLRGGCDHTAYGNRNVIR